MTISKKNDSETKDPELHDSDSHGSERSGPGGDGPEETGANVDGSERRFRERIEEGTEGGLALDEKLRRPSTRGLIFDELQAELEAEPYKVVSVADQVMPEAETSGLEMELADLDLDVGRLINGHRSEKVQQYLGEARAHMTAGRHRQALLPIEAAVSTDPGSIQALAMKGHCLSILGYHEAALKVLRHARGKVTDPDMRILVLRREADIVRAITKKLEEQLIELVEKREIDRAMELVESGLRRQPSNIAFLYHHCKLLWLKGEITQVRALLDEARRHTGRVNLDIFADLERRIDFGAHWPTVEAARDALRRGRSSEAARLLESACGLKGNEYYDALCEYTEKRSGGGLLSLFTGPRMKPNGGATYQQLLRWILGEELKAADQLIHNEDYNGAIRQLVAAGRIDPDCAAVDMLHCRVLYRKNRRLADTGARFNFQEVTKELETAVQLAERAMKDSDFTRDASELIKLISLLRNRLRRHPPAR